MTTEGAVTEKPAKAAKAVKEIAPKQPRKTISGLVFRLFGENAKIERILREVKDQFPDSDFNLRPKLHYSYYRAKYNGAMKLAEKSETNSPAWPAEPRVAKPKAEKPAKAAKAAKASTGAVEQVAQ